LVLEEKAMHIEDLEIFNEMPFLFWVKDTNGKHLFGNRVICDLAGEDVVGKTDRDLIWAKDADSLQAHDRQVLESGKTSFIHEHVQRSRDGEATLNVCKWAGDLDGKSCCFGISFIIDQD
jgi:PAS domain S-box-containing protein